MINVLQLICPTGYYGAERWIVALARNIYGDEVRCHLAVTSEVKTSKIELLSYYPESTGSCFRLEMDSRFDFSVVKMLADIVRKERIDILHSHGYKSDFLAFLVRRHCKGLRIISTPHGYGAVKNRKLQFFNYAGAQVLRYFDRVVPLSSPLHATLAAKGVPEKNMEIICNGLDLTDLHGKKNTQNKSGEPRKIGYVGRLADGKQVDHVIRAFFSLWEKDKSMTLWLAGDGPEREVLEQAAKLLPCSQSIRFLGFVEDRFELMCSLDLFIMTSVSEGTPRNLMEALYLEVPVVAYDVEGVNQLIENEITGLLAPLQDEVTLFNQCNRILSDDTLNQSVRSNGSRFIEKWHSGASLATSYTDLYSRIVSHDDCWRTS